MLSKINRQTRQAVNAALARGQCVYFNHDGYAHTGPWVRIVGAKISKGALMFRALQTGQWFEAGDEWAWEIR